MKGKRSANNIIETYRKRQHMGPFLLGGLAIVLAVGGILVLALWLTGPDKPSLSFSLFASATATPTSTSTPTPITPTPTITETPTITVTPTVTSSATASGPFEYIVQEGDLGYTIAQKFNTDWAIIVKLNNLPTDTIIQVGQKILIPPPDMKLPTNTPLPPDYRGKVEYSVEPGDTLDIIATKFRAVKDDIIRDNKIDDPSTIFVGQVLIIQTGRATPAPTLVPTSGIIPSDTPGPDASPAAPSEASPTPPG